jgi:hemerythrin-like domain-containing protein
LTQLETLSDNQHTASEKGAEATSHWAKQVTTFLKLVELHSLYEEKEMFPKLNEKSPGSLDKEPAVHHELHEMCHAVAALVKELLEESEDKKRALEGLKEALPKLNSFLIQHLDTEESVAMPIIQTKLDQPEIAPLQARIWKCWTLEDHLELQPFILGHNAQQREQYLWSIHTFLHTGGVLSAKETSEEWHAVLLAIKRGSPEVWKDAKERLSDFIPASLLCSA